MQPIIVSCPSCGSRLGVSRLVCSECRISIEGDFSLPGIFRLNRSQLDFVEIFLKNRGVIREVERELGVSYPTVRAKLDDVVRALGYQGRENDRDNENAKSPEGHVDSRRRAILEKLSAGRVTPEEAFEELSGVNKEDPKHD